MNNFSNKVAVLGEAYTANIDDEGWLQFKSYSDVGLPLAYLLDSSVVEVTDDTRENIEGYIEETYELLMSMLEVPEEDRNNFTNFDELVSYIDSKQSKAPTLLAEILLGELGQAADCKHLSSKMYYERITKLPSPGDIHT